MNVNKKYHLEDLDGNPIDIDVSVEKKLQHSRVGDSLLFIYENKIINDLRINRYLKKLKASIQKSMVGATTNGMGGSSAYYIIHKEELLKMIKREIEKQEELIKLNNGDSKQEKKNKSHYELQLTYFKNDFEYFSDSKFDGCYFSINGQHRGDSIDKDLVGTLESVNGDINIEKYAPFKINNNVISYDNLHQLKQKLTSTDINKRIKELHNVTTDDCNQIWEDYLSTCKIDIIELKDVDSWNSLSQFIWYSNSSTSWSEFEHTFKISKTPFTNFIKSKSTDITSEESELEKMIYSDSGMDLKKGKFQKSKGGFEYLLSILFYTSVNPDYLKKFAFPNESFLVDSLLNPSYKIDSNFLNSWYTDLVQLLKIWKNINDADNDFKPLIKKPGVFIMAFFFIQYMKTYRYEKSKETFKIQYDLNKLKNIVEDYLVLLHDYMKPMHKSNTTFWESAKGIEIIKQTEMEDWGCIISKEDVDVTLQSEFDDWVEKCKQSVRKNQDASILLHFTGNLNMWNNDHSAVVSMLTEHLEECFIKKMDEQTTSEIFNEIKWVSTESVTKKKQYLTPTRKGGYSSIKKQLKKKSHSGHDKARANSGSSKIYNLSSEDVEINMRTKNVV